MRHFVKRPDRSVPRRSPHQFSRGQRRPSVSTSQRHFGRLSTLPVRSPHRADYNKTASANCQNSVRRVLDLKGTLIFALAINSQQPNLIILPFEIISDSSSTAFSSTLYSREKFSHSTFHHIDFVYATRRPALSRLR